MKVFFAASPRGDEQFGKLYHKIYNEIKNLGYTLVDDEIVKISSDDFAARMKEGQAAYVEHYKRKMDAIQSADICMFETSIHSVGLGFAIQKSIEAGKPTVVLYTKDTPPYFLFGSDEDKLILKQYNDKNIKKVLEEVFELAKERRDKRFNFFISPKLLDFLEKVSKKEGVTKSKWIRDLIVREMRNQSTS